MRNLSLFLFVVVAVLSRFLPHFPNMTAVGALALFSGAVIQPRWAGMALPILVIALSDLVLGFESSLFFGYAAWALIAFVAGSSLKSFSWARLGGMSAFSTLCFFIISNLGVWLVSGMYPKSAEGLFACFALALPFLGQQMLGDLLFSGVLFLSWRALEKNFLAQKAVL